MLEPDTSWEQALRFFAGVHHLVLTGAAPDALSGSRSDLDAAVTAHLDELGRFVRERGVQTNEVARCVGLLPAFLTVARETGLPLDLVELGPSAGLNLLADRYRYAYRQGTWGPADAALLLEPEERRPVPAELLAVPLEIRERLGIDLAPVDAISEDGYLLLRSFLWPGREARVTRLDAAVATLRSAPSRPRLVRGDYVALLPGVLEGRAADAVTVVFQTASTGFVPDTGYASLMHTLEEAGADGRPLAWVSSRRREERMTDVDDAWELELRVWPEATRLVAHLDFHGNWLSWVDGAP